MFNLQGSEIVVILLLALVVLGPEKLPDAIRKFTQTYSEFKKMSSGFQSELKSALDEPMREMRETANQMRDAVDPNKIIAEAEAEQRLRDDAARVGDEPPMTEKPVSPGGPVDPFAAVGPDVDPVNVDPVNVDPLDVEPPSFDAETVSDPQDLPELDQIDAIDPARSDAGDAEPSDEAAAS